MSGRERRPLLNRTSAEWLLVTLVCALLAAITASHGLLWRLDRVFYDAIMGSRQLPADPDVVIVAIDDRSLADIGRWPWDRAVHAALLERLIAADTAAVAFDIILNEPDPAHPAADAALARLISAHGRVVLPMIHAGRAAQGDGEGLPIPPFAEAAAAIGHIHMELDPDGIARSVYLWEGQGAPRHPQLALAMLGLVAPQQAAKYLPPPATTAPGWRRAGWMHIPFRGPPGTFRYISYVDILRGDVPPSALRNAVVFVGASAVGMGDSVPTPTSGHARPMPGVEINASIFSALRAGKAIQVVSPQLSALLSALVVVAAMLAMLRLGPRLALLAAFGFSACTLLLAWLLLTQAQQWLPPVGAVLACMLAYPLWSWRRLEAAQNYLDTELSALSASSGLFDLATNGDPSVPMDRFAARISVVRDAARTQRAMQRFIADTLDSLPAGVAVLDRDGGVRLTNRQARELLGEWPTHQLPAPLAALPWPGGTPGGDALKPERPQLEAELADGRTLLVSTAALYEESGDRLGTVIGLVEITDLRAAQRAREDTLYFLSHDLRAPLASILLLAEGNATPELQGRISFYARSALGLVENLFRLVRAQTLDPARFMELPLEMVLQDAAEEVWALAQAKEIQLVTELPTGDDEPCLVRGDGDLLCRALVNLLTNAIKYTPNGGQVTLTLAAAGEEWALSVCDTGAGIDEELSSRLFQRFSRLPTAENRRISGVGLGLAMVRAVAERHGGSVSVTSQPGAGACFTLRLPPVTAGCESTVSEIRQA